MCILKFFSQLFSELCNSQGRGKRLWAGPRLEILGAGDEVGGWDRGWRDGDGWEKAGRSSDIMRN